MLYDKERVRHVVVAFIVKSSEDGMQLYTIVIMGQLLDQGLLTLRECLSPPS
jgi:hypothetical protein